MTLVWDPGVRQRTVAKARVLLDALPYIKEHGGTTVVVKLGGAAMEDRRLLSTFAEDVALLRLTGVRPVVVHGGGPQISALSERLGVTPRFVNGLRVTDPETMDVAAMVLIGRINREIVTLINRQGVATLGVSGTDADLLAASPRPPQDGVDLGLVGRVERVNAGALTTLMERFVPVIAGVATDGRGQPLNVNADEVAASVAVAMGAGKLVYLTDVPGLYEDADGVPSLLSEVPASECRRLLAEGAVSGGMIPKVEGVLRALGGGVGRAHILDGRAEHALILELFTPEGVGTMVTPDAATSGAAQARASEVTR